MSQLVLYFESNELTKADYENILAEMGEKLANANRPTHIAFQKGDSWCVVDVWNSEEAMNDFAANVIMPAFAKLGLVPPQPQVFPVHNMLNA